MMATHKGNSVTTPGHMVCIDDFESYAEKTLASSTLGYVQGGADDELTLKDNVAAFRRYQIRPRVLRDVTTCNTETTILGHRIAFPICIAPVGSLRMVHPDGDLATAKAAAAVNTGLLLSTFSTSALEEVTEASAGKCRFLQLYCHPDREVVRRLVMRAERAGYSAIFLTADVPVVGKRRAQSYNPSIFPSHIQLPNLEKYETGQKVLTLASQNVDPSITWDTVTWLKSITNLPIVVKGILTGEDAEEAVKRGVSGILVSNHGGRQLDSAPATLDVLPEVVQAVAGRCEVYLDGGVRTGTDVFKALALGARAVFIGRPFIYGLVYNGEAGVRQVLNILQDEFRRTMALAGCCTLDEITKSFIRYPTHSFVPVSKL